MGLEELAKKIIDLRADAKSKCITWHARKVAQVLGEHSERQMSIFSDSDARDIYEFAKNGLNITDEVSYDSDCDGYTTDYHYVTILYRKKQVFKASNQVEVYKPGAWIKKLDEFYTEAIKPDLSKYARKSEHERIEKIKKEMDRLKYLQDLNSEAKKWNLKYKPKK